MDKLELAEQIILNSTAYKIRQIVYTKEKERLRVQRTEGGAFHSIDIIAALQVCEISSYLTAKENNVELVIIY